MRYTTGLASMLGIVLALSPLAGGALQSQPKQEPKQQPQTQQPAKQAPKQQQPKQGQQQPKQTPKQQQPKQGQQQPSRPSSDNNGKVNNASSLNSGRVNRRSVHKSRPNIVPRRCPQAIPLWRPSTASRSAASELIQVSYDWFAATAIEELIVHRVIEQEARAQGVSVSVEEVEARYKQRLQSAEAQLPPGMSLDDFLKRNQVPPSRLFAQTRTLLLAEKLLERQVNLDDFVEYSQLVIRIQGNTPEQQEENTPAAEAKAQEAYQKIKEGLDFAEAVKEYSEDPFSKDRGGKMNWQDMKFIVPDLRQKLQAMQPGEISETVQNDGQLLHYPQGAHGGRKPRPKSSRKLREQAVRLQLVEYVRQLQAKAKITNTIVKPFDPTTAAPSEPGGPRPPAARPVPR
jgi:hypothetical protein